MSEIHVCSLARLEQTVSDSKARFVISAINPWSIPSTPPGVAPDNHLRIAINDIEAPFGELVHPERHHVEKIIQFARTWNRDGPLVIHCLAGISRSSASAFIVACTLATGATENSIARHLRQVSSAARPNRLMISLADEILNREGRMIAAISAMSPSAAAMDADTYTLAMCY